MALATGFQGKGMLKSLWAKFLVLLIAVVAIGLSATFLLRELMVKDFRVYLEGEREDRAYWVTAALESSYDKYSGWREESIIENTVWAMMLGIEMKLFDTDGTLIMDTDMAINTLSPFVKKRVMAISERRVKESDSPFSPYALFLGGRQIGTLEVRFLLPQKEKVFIRRSNRFLLISLLALGGIAVFLSIVFSRKMTRPIKALTSAAAAIEEGDLRSRVGTSGNDEIGRLSDAFNRMARKLEVQEALRKKLTSNIAHELRTPISAIRGELEGMIDGLISADKETLKSLYAEIGRLKSILNGIEDLSQAEASSLMIRKVHLHLQPFLRNITERFRKASMDKGVSLELSCDDDLAVGADPDKLSQIIINLLSNALKATEKNGRVWVRAMSGGDKVRIEVGDTGCGIRDSDLPFIFERFYRASEGGLGIGLTIVKELAEAHGGKITAQSSYGKGSVFTLLIPA
ncbi:MAG: HAMP domain-containing histidine kinase [Nitrospirota bacterium]|nr:HAMP domain-containing histidine kinase [Nitrospirota bacterium]